MLENAQESPTSDLQDGEVGEPDPQDWSKQQVNRVRRKTTRIKEILFFAPTSTPTHTCFLHFGRMIELVF